MIEVHAPHKPLHGFWEFLLHLFTISVGLLIATQIESCVEWRHHVHLAEEARAQLRTEIEQNLKQLKAAQPNLKRWRASVEADLAAVGKIQEHPSDRSSQHTNLVVNSGGISLRDTAWKTAESTGALAYMPYDEARRYASIYQAQAALKAMEDKPEEDVANILGLIEKFHITDTKRISGEEASALAERFGQMRVHLASGDVALRVCIEVSQAFLENRAPQEDFHETLP